MFYDRRHRYAEAIDHFNSALALSPGNAQVCYSMALAYLDDSQYDNAIKLLHKAIELGPYLEAPYGNLGLTYLRRGHFADAVASWKSLPVSTRTIEALEISHGFTGWWDVETKPARNTNSQYTTAKDC